MKLLLVDDEVTMIQIMEKAIDWKRKGYRRFLWLIMRMKQGISWRRLRLIL